MASGDVSIRLSLQNVETVRAGLEKLGSDGQAALKKLEAGSTAPSHGLSAIDKTVDDLKSRVDDAGRSLGPLGTLLTGLGPIGTVAAAGLAVAVGIMYEMAKAADELSERAAALKNFAEATGFTTTQVQALTAEGAKFSLTTEQITTGLQRLAVALADAKLGRRELYEDLYRIKPQLAHQVAGANDLPDAYDLIGNAIRRAEAAHNATQANRIARAAFGRDFGAQGVLAADVSAAGGVNAQAASYQNAGKALDDGLIKRLAQLRAEIQQTQQRTKDLTASLFSEDVLQRTLAMDQALERMALHVKEMSEATKGESWGQWLMRMGAQIGVGDADPTGEIREKIEQEMLMASARRRLQSGLAAGKRSDTYLDKSWQPAGRGDDATASVEKISDAADQAKVPIEAVLADTKKWMAVLGSAATPAEQLKLKVLELAVAQKDHAASAQVAARALQALKDSQTVAAEATRESIGLASEAEIVTAGLIKLREDEAKGFIRSAAEMQQAEERLLRSAQERFKQEQVANSAFQGLTRMSQGASLQDVDKLATGMLDSLSVASVNAMNAVNQVGTAYNTLGLHINATTASSNAAAAAFLNWGRQAVQSIEQVLFKAIVLAPLLQALGLGSGSGGGFSFFKGGSGFADGGIMTSMGPLPLRRYASGGVTDRPQLAMFGEGSKPEAYVPLPDGRSIPAVVSLKGMAGGNNVSSQTHFHISMPPGTTPETAREISKNFAGHLNEVMEQVVDQRILRHLQSGGMLNL